MLYAGNGTKNWHNAGMSSKWGTTLFGIKTNKNNNKERTECPTQNNKSKQ